MHRVQLIGLRPQYEDDELPVRGWIRTVLAMSMLPASYDDMAWSTLKVPPVTDDPDVFNKMQSFATYVERRG